MAKKETKKVVKKEKSSKKLSVTKPFSKAELLLAIAERVDLQKKQVGAVLDTLVEVISAHLSKKGPGVFAFPGVAKFRVVHRPAKKSRKGKNPFTGEEMTYAAKPACNVVKIRVLKGLKDAVK